MTSDIEALFARDLQVLLEEVRVGEAFPKSPALHEVTVDMEFWIPTVLEWEEESLDGFRFLIARRSGEREAEFYGLALLIDDQAWTPVQLRVTLSPAALELTSFECHLGVPGAGKLGLQRLPYGSPAADQLFLELPESPSTMPWVYRASRSAI